MLILCSNPFQIWQLNLISIWYKSQFLASDETYVATSWSIRCKDISHMLGITIVQHISHHLCGPPTGLQCRKGTCFQYYLLVLSSTGNIWCRQDIRREIGLWWISMWFKSQQLRINISRRVLKENKNKIKNKIKLLYFYKLYRQIQISTNMKRSGNIWIEEFYEMVIHSHLITKKQWSYILEKWGQNQWRYS